MPMIAVHRKGEKPLHRQIYDEFRTMILERSLQAGQQIPSTRALADELGISRIPVLDAYAQLLAEGYIESRAGAGTFVTSSLSDRFLNVRPTVLNAVNDSGSDAISRVSRLLPVEGTPWFRGSGAFSVGQIAYDHFPFRVWSDLVTHHARRVRASSMNYSDPMGSEEFRRSSRRIFERPEPFTAKPLRSWWSMDRSTPWICRPGFCSTRIARCGSRSPATNFCATL